MFGILMARQMEGNLLGITPVRSDPSDCVSVA